MLHRNAQVRGETVGDERAVARSGLAFNTEKRGALGFLTVGLNELAGDEVGKARASVRQGERLAETLAIPFGNS